MADLSTTQGLYFEDFAVGDGGVTQGRTITETDIVNFAALTGDWNAIHVDKEYASKGMFGERIAHGLLGLSVASGLAVQLGFMRETVIAFMGLSDWRFKAPMKIGDTIRTRLTVTQCKDMRRLGGGIITLDVEILNQRDEVTQQGGWSLLVKSKPAG